MHVSILFSLPHLFADLHPSHAFNFKCRSTGKHIDDILTVENKNPHITLVRLRPGQQGTGSKDLKRLQTRSFPPYLPGIPTER